MSTKIYVGNLSFNTSENTLTEHFNAFGSVESCKIITDRDTGRSKGFGFIEMGSSDEAKQAISELDGKEFEGRNIRVNEAKPQEKRPSRW